MAYISPWESFLSRKAVLISRNGCCLGSWAAAGWTHFSWQYFPRSFRNDSVSASWKTELIAEHAILLGAVQQIVLRTDIGNLLLLFIFCISCKTKENWACSAVPDTENKTKQQPSFPPKDVTECIKGAWEHKGSWLTRVPCHLPPKGCFSRWGDTDRTPLPLWWCWS